MYINVFCTKEQFDGFSEFEDALNIFPVVSNIALIKNNIKSLVKEKKKIKKKVIKFL